MKNQLITVWMTPKFPLIHLSGQTSFIKKWFFHPIKRRIAKYYLRLLQIFTGIKVIAITGSAGKTTTKEITASILKRVAKTVWTTENIDPIYNIPSTILKTPPGTKYLILEMGVEYPNEMDFYLWLAKPDIGVITNIFPTHTKYLENQDGVFKEKSKLALSLGSNDLAILNSSDKYLLKLKAKTKSQIKWFTNGVSPKDTCIRAATEVAKALNVPGSDIKLGIQNYTDPPHRLKILKLASGATILDDSYNSNPYALLAAIKYFDEISTNKKKIAVIGDMLELGKIDETEHRRIGENLVRNGFSHVIGVGKSVEFMIDEINKLDKNIHTISTSNYEEAHGKLKPLLKQNVAVLVKGSRSIHLDKLVDKLS